MGSDQQDDLTPVPVDFPGCLQQEFPEQFDVVWQATEDVVSAISGADLSPLAKHSPGLLGYDWSGYLRCSAARLVRVVALLQERGVTGGRAVDVGAYFGNTSLVLARLGFDAQACDAYDDYEGCLESALSLLRAAGGSALDTGVAGEDLSLLPDAVYDVVTCLGVIEHVPHTPRLLLQQLRRILKPGGHLVVDTPNLAYVFKRWQLARGESVYAPLATQFYSDIPFEGHHREYTGDELLWMLERAGFEQSELVTFDYSRLALSELSGDTLKGVRIAERDPSARELLMTISRRPDADPRP